jgi:hypothetical protein
MGTYTGAELVLVGLYVQQRLAAYDTELDAVSVGLSTRIYEDVAPDDATYPCIVWQCQTPPRDVRGVGTFRVMVDTLYLVKAVSQAASYEPLAPVARVIDMAMTDPTGSAVGDGHVFTSVRNDQFSMREAADGTQFRHLGGAYRIQAQG